jgi:hypothetical protein
MIRGKFLLAALLLLLIGPMRAEECALRVEGPCLWRTPTRN